MKTTGVTTYQYQAAEETRKINKDLGKDEFLKILVAQFQGQNPLEPLKDTEFIAQMAQFSSLEQLQNISGKLDGFQEDVLWNQYLSLLGKEVSGFDEEGMPISGVVTGVTFKDGQYRLSIDGVEQKFLSLVSVKLVPEPASEIETIPPETTGEQEKEEEMDA